MNISKKTYTLIFALVLVFILAFAVRSHLMMYKYAFGFDTYYHGRMVGLILQNGELPKIDPLGYYWYNNGEGFPLKPQDLSPIFYSFAIFAYRLLFGSGYSQANLLFIMKLLPALYGALISVAMYFFIKELAGKKAGLYAALFAAIVPAFVYRTMSGFFEEDSLGFLWMIIGFAFTARAVKFNIVNRRSVLYSILAGVFLGLMSWTWKMFILVPVAMGFYFVLQLAYFFIKPTLKYWLDKKKITAKMYLDEFEAIKPFLANFIIAMLIFSLMATAYWQTSWITQTYSYLVQYTPWSAKNVEHLLNPRSGILGLTVGEEANGFPYWGIKYNALLLFPIFLLFVIPLRMWKEDKRRADALLWAWVAVTLFMAFGKLKFTYVFGLPIAASAGYTLGFLWQELKTNKDARYLGGFLGISLLSIALGLAGKIYGLSEFLIWLFLSAILLAGGYYIFGIFDVERRGSLLYKILTGSLVFMALTGVASGVFFVSQKYPSIGPPTPTGIYWEQAFNWIDKNLPKDARIFNWWNMGHPLLFFGHRKAVCDNRNSDIFVDQNVAQFLLSSDPKKAMQIVKHYNANYILLSKTTLGSLQSLEIYADSVLDTSDPRLAKYDIIATPCVSKGQSYVCNGLSQAIPASEMYSFPVTWTAAPTQLLAGRYPQYIYRSKDNNQLFFLQPNQIQPQAAAYTNNTMAVRLFFDDPTLSKYIRKVYENPEVKIFKVLSYE